jgi:glutaredoxin
MFGWMGRAEARQGGTGDNTARSGAQVRLALYKYDACPYCQRVFRAIDKLEVAVEYRDVRTDVNHRQELRARTGRTSVPCLFIDDEPMFESADIVAWLHEQFSE